MNYAELFRTTLPETMLEIAALAVLVSDLAFLRKAALKTRVAIAAVLGVIGCALAGWALRLTAGQPFLFPNEVIRSARGVLIVHNDVILSAGGYVTVAQAGILVLTAITLLLLIEETFTRHIGEFVAVVLMAAAGGMIVASAQDLLVIFVGLELLSLGLYILTAFAKSSGKSAEAAIKYYLFGGMSAAFLLFGFSYIYGITGSTNLAQIRQAIFEQGPSPLLYVAWILVIAGLGFKVAAVPFHLWAPDTYEGAPAPAAAFIASVSKVASFALLLTVCTGTITFSEHRGSHVDWNVIDRQFEVFHSTWYHFTAILLLVAAASMIVGNLAALAQTSVRRLLAYSAIAHAGYMLLALGTFQPYMPPPSQGQSIGIANFLNLIISAQSPLFYYVLTYGLTTIGAFGVVAVVERATGSDKMDAFLGLHKRNPLLAGVLLVLFLSLAGIPPLVGFWAKFNLFAAVLNVSAGPIPFALVALAVAMSAVSLYYYLQVLKRAYVMPIVDETPIKTHPVTMLVLVAIALAVVVLGCFPTLLQGWIESAYR
jgi:NADH-quinone oxidoreductase subunit N